MYQQTCTESLSTYLASACSSGVILLLIFSMIERFELSSQPWNSMEFCKVVQNLGMCFYGLLYEVPLFFLFYTGIWVY